MAMAERSVLKQMRGKTKKRGATTSNSQLSEHAGDLLAKKGAITLVRFFGSYHPLSFPFFFFFFLTVVFIRFFIIYLFISSEIDIFSFPVSLPPFLNRIQFLIKRDNTYIYKKKKKREKDRIRLHASMRQLR